MILHDFGLWVEVQLLGLRVLDGFTGAVRGEYPLRV